MTTSTDRIEKKVFLKAPIARVWRAIGDAREFGAWFGVDFDGAFTSGARLRGVCVPTQADPKVAAAQEAYRGAPFEITVERVVPNRLLSFRWHPFAVDPKVDYAGEPTTLVELAIEEAPGGTHLTITESGFDKVPLERRAKAFAMNDHGWTEQAQLVAKHLHAA